jgi:hypothetical protein
MAHAFAYIVWPTRIIAPVGASKIGLWQSAKRKPLLQPHGSSGLSCDLDIVFQPVLFQVRVDKRFVASRQMRDTLAICRVKSHEWPTIELSMGS